MTFDLGSAAKSGSEEPEAQGGARREAQPDAHAPSRGGKPCGFDVARWARERLAAGASARLGVMGGTFDPVHQGHLHCAESAREACGLDAVLFMPAFLPNFKQGRVCAEAVDRMAMCRLAVASNPAFFVSGLEIERGKVTYTADTLRELREVLPAQAEVTFILGADSLATLMRWHDAESLPALASFAAVARPGHEIDPALLARLADADFDVRVVEASGLDVSSTEVRRRLRRGDSVRYLVPEPARRYIEERGLYAPAPGSAECVEGRVAFGGLASSGKSEPFCNPKALGAFETPDGRDAFVDSESSDAPGDQDALSLAFFEARKAELATRVSPKRFQHVMGVVEACERLARIHGVDVPTARLAGLLHDWDKGFDDEGIWQRAASLGLDEALDPWVFANMPQVLHAHTAAVALAREFPQIPREIIQAIDRHTVGDENMTPLEMVLYCADCIEDGRQFGIIPELRELADQVSLEELFFRVYEFWALNLLGRRNMLHPVTMKVWNTLLARRAAEKGK